ncbi:MAG: hypothetical protein OXI39_00065 [Gemmatimonadota bacterium]|uniref:hypothetical protein n=1 Tax=Candidatus Palauibacter scopulicola TaxID=3056741 RepID=UPI00239413D0|nr:hypothetical protein [Candidatus Palauibacter scopulicola]MDE2661386.1 hypothetical protein [Candidatus Palauibacter scopulicola]
MGLTGPPAIRHLAVGFARRYDADISVATDNVVHCTLHHRRRGQHAAGIADKLIRNPRAVRIPEEVRKLPAAVAEV